MSPSTSAEKVSRRSVSRWLAFAALGVVGAIFVTLIYYYYLYISSPLSSDEAMIAKFDAHRADFDALLKLYQSRGQVVNAQGSYCRAGEATVRDLCIRADLANVEDAGPFVYQTHTTTNHGGQVFHHFSSSYLAIALTPRQGGEWHGVYPTLSKTYLFFPEVPRIENGLLLQPEGAKALFAFRGRVLPSLNRLPYDWEHYECVYRQIESQWFLELCNSGYGG